MPLSSYVVLQCESQGWPEDEVLLSVYLHFGQTRVACRVATSLICVS
jgi:hypothetical protein